MIFGSISWIFFDKIGELSKTKKLTWIEIKKTYFHYRHKLRLIEHIRVWFDENCYLMNLFLDYFPNLMDYRCLINNKKAIVTSYLKLNCHFLENFPFLSYLLLENLNCSKRFFLNQTLFYRFLFYLMSKNSIVLRVHNALKTLKFNPKQKIFKGKIFFR